MFKYPGFIRHLPVGMLLKRGPRVLEIGFVVGPEVDAGLIGGPELDMIEERGLNQSVFVVPFFGPRVGKEDEDVPEKLSRREGLKKKARICLDEVQVVRLGPPLLSRRPLNAIALDIDADTEFVRMGLGVGHEKVTMPAAELTDERGGLGKYRGKRGAERGPPVFQERQKAFGAGRIFHDDRVNLRFGLGLLGGGSPARFDHHH